MVLNRRKLKTYALWLLIGAIVLVTVMQFASHLFANRSTLSLLQVAGSVATSLVPLGFAGAGGLIVTRQSGNVIGWLLIVVAALLPSDALTAFLLGNISDPLPNPPFLLYFAVWFSQVGWLLLIFPTLFIALLFPTGKPPSPRWRWVAGYGLGLMFIFWSMAVLAKDYIPNENYGLTWSLQNPIGLLSNSSIDAIVFPWWLLGLGSFALLCVASLVVRYRRGRMVEREQIKWLLFAAGLFALVYIPPLVLIRSAGDSPLAVISDLLLPLGLLGFPIAITTAILRYQLWDINVIIRKTVVYAVLTALLALVYFGVIIVLQNIFEAVSGEQSAISIVVSTLVIAALFAPLRRRVQDFIDRRFYRRRYDAEKTLSAFAQFVRDETDLEALRAELLRVTQETMQPEQVSIWLKRVAGTRAAER
ncbi:MAG: hypothetical protein PVH65_11900 [Chloroflexota bacterium]|jgi:hypothetical protein